MKITLLDGGMGQELVHRAGDRPTPLWSTQVMTDHPGLVAEVHRDFTAAGATIATTNTYAIHHDRLDHAGIPDQFEGLHKTALKEAHDSDARRIAGSIGPLGASYRPDLHPPHLEATALYAEIVDLLSPHVDLFLCETVASLAHADAILEATKTSGKPVWLALTVSDTDGTQLRSGEPLTELPNINADRADAILINCSVPEAIPAALDAIKPLGKPFGAYANGFEMITEGFLEDAPTVDALSMRKDFTPEGYADHAMAWIEQGATIIGGCCEVSPTHIKAIADRLNKAGHEIV